MYLLYIYIYKYNIIYIYMYYMCIKIVLHQVSVSSLLVKYVCTC